MPASHVAMSPGIHSCAGGTVAAANAWQTSSFVRVAGSETATATQSAPSNVHPGAHTQAPPASQSFVPVQAGSHGMPVLPPPLPELLDVLVSPLLALALGSPPLLEVAAPPPQVRTAADVADAFAADPELGPACLIVDCRDGEVVLIGDVATAELAVRAVQVAHAVPTVGSVVSHVRVAPPAVAQAASHSVNGTANGAASVATLDGPEAQ